MPKFGKILKTFAPIAASFIPGGGPAAMAAKTILSNALGVDPASSEEQIEQAMAVASPETLAKIKQADLEFKAQLEKYRVDEVRAYLRDRDSARKREATVKDKTPSILAYLVVGGTFAFAFAAGHLGVDAQDRVQVLGLLGTALGLVLSYYFGTSAGADKTARDVRDLSVAHASDKRRGKT